MVKRTEFDCRMEGVTVSDYWDALYADGTAQQGFYKEVHGDHNCTVTQWDGGKRVVSAQLPLQLPTFAKSIIGCDTVSVQDTQMAEWYDRGTPGSTRLEITATPMMMAPGASSFTVTIVYDISETDGGVLVVAAITANAIGPWGLTGAIETIMLDSSRGGVESWLHYGEQAVQKRVTEKKKNAGSKTLVAAMSRALQGSFRMRREVGSPEGRAAAMHFRTKSLLERDIQEAMVSGADALDILEAVDTRRSMCDLAKDSLFFEGGLIRSYEKCMMNALYCTESLSSSDEIDAESRQDMVTKISDIRGALQNINLQRERFMAALHEYELENGVLVHRLVDEVQRLKAEVTLANQEAIIANDAARSIRGPPRQRLAKMPAKKITEADIMKMKKEELKEVITKNGWISYYKSSMLKADMQVLALKSIGLGSDLPMPVAKTPFKTPGKTTKTPGTTPKTASTASPSVAPPSTATRKSRRMAIKKGLAEADEPLPDSTDEYDSDDTEDDSGADDQQPGSTGWTGEPSVFWNAVDYVAAYWAFAVVILFIAVVVGYVVLESPMKDSIQEHLQTFKKMILDKLDDAKKAAL
eukprot:jgi/Tetstr1/454672/TSEL_041562.t1